MENKSFKEILGSWIQKAQEEADEIRMQLSLGKMEASDAFEKVKKELLDSSNNFREEMKSFQQVHQVNLDAVKTKLQTLQVQLALGKADAKELFFDQKEKITKAMNELEQGMRSPQLALSPELKIKMQHEIEKFKLKADILKIKYEVGKVELKEEAQNKRASIKKEFDEVISKIDDVKEDASAKLESYGSELKKYYEKIKSNLSRD